MPYVITIILVLSGFFFKKSKYLFVIQILWMWVLIGGSPGDADYRNYADMFIMFGHIKPTAIGLEGLYSLSCYLATQAGMNFEIYSLITTGIALLLIASTIIKFTNRPCFVMSLFFFFPMVDCAIQRRNFIASAVVIFGVRFLIDSGITNKLKFIFCVLIASGFHSISLIYLLFLLSDYVSTNMIKKFIVPFDIICFLLIPIIPKIAALFMSGDRLYSYFYDLSNRLSLPKVCIFMLWQILNTAYLVYFNGFQNKALAETENITFGKFDKLTVNINIILTMVLPFFYYNSTFYRIYRNILVLNYILAANRQMKDINDKRNLKVFFASIIFIAIPILSYTLFYVPLDNMGATSLSMPVFEDNFIVDNFLSMFK